MENPKLETPDYLVNNKGHHVPASMVQPADKLEDQIVLELFEKALTVSHNLREFKQRAFLDIRTFIELIGEKYDVQKGGAKGNMSLMSYDGLTKIVVSNADYISFGPQLNIAKQLIDDCIKDWGKDSNDNIRALVDHAFRVDKNNRVNTQAILGLRRIAIKDEKWKQAMEAITDSIRPVSSKEYVRFYHRESTEAEWKSVVLDFAGL